ncbi:MAG: phage tail protein [Candidatus Accumulibacter sp.]|uniref:phage baseplate assembly protein V n=1 Tax=Accumulibacter sp. TaxID=2053492 RepID=UPI001A3E02C3|nr:phage baseplate assembly protein V [Accumulibacter sp.]MBL8394635.1 phage tail protein [Accumulibacter sp.]
MSDTERALVQTLRSQRTFGKYRGFVVDNADPDRRGRVKLQVPALLGDQATDWALPCVPYGGLADQGWFCVPEVGAQVWVEFEGGDLTFPIWTGTFWQAAGDPPAEATAQPQSHVFKTAGGHYLSFEDSSGAEQVHLEHAGGATLDIDAQGTVALTDQNGAHLTLDAAAGELLIEDANGNSLKMSASGVTVEDASGNKIEMAASGTTVKAMKIVVDGQQVLLGGEGGEPVIKGQSFLTLFATHVHTCTAPGSPTSPPIPQGEMSSLSFKVKTA